MRFVWAVQVASTLFMVGVIWFVQLVQYPGMARIPVDAFPEWQRANIAATGRLVIVPMVLETVTALILMWRRPPGASRDLMLAGLGMLAVIWTVTALVVMPMHRMLQGAFDPEVHRTMVLANWLRTLPWTFRGGLIVWLLTRPFPRPSSEP